MKKCPVCGVEHSDIVHVCSICGSPLDDTGAAQLQNTSGEQSAPEAPAAPVSEGNAPMSEDLATDDIRKTISSVVNGTGNQEPAPAGEEPFEVDNPFVIDTTKEPPQPQSQPRSSARRGRRGQRSGKPRNPEMDTTIVAAASAQKVYEATQNAIAARNAQASAPQPAPEPPAPAKAPESTAGEINWSQRKHTRDKSRASQRVVLAVCAFLALLIVAILVVFGKMIFGGDSGATKDNQPQSAPVEVTEAATEPTEAPSEETEFVTEEELTEEATEPAEEESEEEVVDPDLAAQQQEQAGDGTGAEPAETAEPATEPAPEPTHPAELPAITDANDTVYAVSDVNVRDYPGTQGSTVIRVLTAGQSAKRTGTTANGWSRVEIGGKVGYVSSKYLSTNQSDVGKSQSGDGTVTISTSGVNMRDVPNGNIIATLNSGDKVKPTGKTQGAWTEVTFNDKTGYIYSTYVSSVGSSGGDSTKVTETNDTMYVVSGVNVRSEPSTNGAVLTTLKGGQEVSRIGTTSNGWSKVKVGNTTGYVYSSYLSSTKGGSGESGNNSGGSSKTKNGYVLPESDSRVYSLSELKKLSKSDLRLARNEIYARHGRKFNDKSLQDYFNSCSWYKGTVDPATFDANVNSYLNDYEIANLSAISEAEGG